MFEQIKWIDPELILLLGSVAVKKLLGAKTVEAIRGRVVERDGRKFLATYHPAVRFYREDLAKKIKIDFELLRNELTKIGERVAH